MKSAFKVLLFPSHLYLRQMQFKKTAYYRAKCTWSADFIAKTRNYA